MRSSPKGGSDVAWIIRRLCTNGGFYGSLKPRLFEAELRAWCKRYETALFEADAWVDCQSCYHLAFGVQQQFLQRRKHLGINIPHLLAAPGPNTFYRGLDGRKVVVVTAYSDAMASVLCKSRLPPLFAGIAPPDATFMPVQAPLSTWPMRPGQNWWDSYHQLKSLTNEFIQQHDADMLIAAAGCYGLPLCRDIREERGIAAVYLGQVINSYLGILSNSIEHVLQLHQVQRLESGAWRPSKLNAMPGMNLIDDGRYGWLS